MKKAGRALFLLSAAALLLCIGALAADPETAGVYGVTDVAEGVTIVPDGALQDPVTIREEPVLDFYAGAETVTVTYSGAVNGAFYLLIVTNTETTTPQDADIVYIDQLTATDAGVTFTVYPPMLDNGTYYVYLSSSAGEKLGSSGLTKIGAFRSFAPYLRGDVDENGSLSVNDALYVLECVADKRTLSGYAALAADADGDGDVSASDALYILQAVAHIRAL